MRDVKEMSGRSGRDEWEMRVREVKEMSELDMSEYHEFCLSDLYIEPRDIVIA